MACTRCVSCIATQARCGYDGSNANAADIPAFRPAADESGEYKVEDILDHRSHGHGRS